MGETHQEQRWRKSLAILPWGNHMNAIETQNLKRTYQVSYLITISRLCQYFNMH
jgi:hypothetical protein